MALTWPNRVFIGLRLPGLPTLIGLELLNNSALLVSWAFLIVLFYRERRVFPRLFQLWLGFGVVARLAELTLSFHLGAGSTWEGAANVTQQLHAKLGMGFFEYLVSGIIWISYFEVSERVKATFVR